MLINNKVIPEEAITTLIADIKQKKELQHVTDEFVRDQLFAYLQKNPKKANLLVKRLNVRSGEYKQIVKEVRSRLRRIYGVFRLEENAAQRRDLVDTLMQCPYKRRIEFVKKILQTHSSTKERLNFYERLYEKIFTITGKPETILDIGCGINPFSVPLMKLRKAHYLAHDISEEEISLLNVFFSWLHQHNRFFTGKAEVLDILHFARMRQLRNADICFLFKMTDVFDRGKGHKVSEQVISLIPATFVVVSFPTITMSGKKMNFPRRKWIELMCKRLGYKYKILTFSNEIFYVIKK